MPSVSVDRLQPGVFISLGGLRWLDHPFLLSRFRLNDFEQIRILREMGLKTVEWDPERSTAEPLSEPEVVEREVDFGGNALQSMLDLKRQRTEVVRQQRESLARCERLFEKETTGAADILRDLSGRPAESYGKAKAIVGRLVGNLVNADSVAVHLVNMKTQEPGLAHHAMSVTVLSLLIGKTLGASEDDMKHLGIGALFHDIGKLEVPSRVLRNAQRTPSEELFYQAHVGYGIKGVAGIPNIEVAVKNIIACHHERWDGQGFPNKLSATAIPRLARMVAIANRYENLCNPFDLKTAHTPSEAVARMFKREAGAFDPEMLQAFVKALGVYPPGSFVLLSDGSVGLVVETNSNELLRPLVMLHDASVPRSEALLLDLRETGLSIQSAINPAKLPLDVVEYLAPRGRVDYYIEGSR